MRNHTKSVTGALVGVGLAIGFGAIGAAAASNPQQVPSAASPRVQGATSAAGVKGQHMTVALPATALSPAGAGVRLQVTKGQRTSVAPPATAASPAGAGLNRPTTKPAR